MYFRRALKLDRHYLSAWTLMGHEYVEMKNTSAAIGQSSLILPGNYHPSPCCCQVLDDRPLLWPSQANTNAVLVFIVCLEKPPFSCETAGCKHEC